MPARARRSCTRSCAEITVARILSSGAIMRESVPTTARMTRNEFSTTSRRKRSGSRRSVSRTRSIAGGAAGWRRIKPVRTKIPIACCCRAPRCERCCGAAKHRRLSIRVRSWRKFWCARCASAECRGKNTAQSGVGRAMTRGVPIAPQVYSAMNQSLDGRFVDRRRHYRRSVMQHHPPLCAGPRENVGSQDLGFDRAFSAALREILLEHDVTEIGRDASFDNAKIELHFEDVLENALPATHDGTPSRKLGPSRMNAEDVRVLEPDRFHLLGIEAFEGAVEGAIRFEQCFAVRHQYLPGGFA